MNNMAIAQESIKITKEQRYVLNGREIELPAADHSAVEVYSPERGIGLLSEPIPQGTMCRICVTNEDSFQAARRYDHPLVMNFANAHHAGGGFLIGANAQEEALCRCSTLYASINSKAAEEMYHYNNTHASPVESDYMLYSPDVCVFRNEKCELLETPFTAAVITVPAPNRYGAAMIVSKNTIRDTMCRRIRIMLKAAAKHGHKDLVLGAWGCGAFGNSPEDVSLFFREIIIDETYGNMFDEICFAIYGSTESRNYTAFYHTFVQ